MKGGLKKKKIFFFIIVSPLHVVVVPNAKQMERDLIVNATVR